MRSDSPITFFIYLVTFLEIVIMVTLTILFNLGALVFDAVTKGSIGFIASVIEIVV